LVLDALVHIHAEHIGAGPLSLGKDLELLSLGDLSDLRGALLQKVDGVPLGFRLYLKNLVKSFLEVYRVTYDPGILLHCVSHLVGESDGLLLGCFVGDGVPLGIRILYHGGHFSSMLRVYDVEEISTVAGFALLKLRRHIGLHRRPVSKLSIETLDAQLGIVSDLHGLQF